MKIIRSVRDTRGNVIQKSPDGGVGRTRCPKCQMLCTAQRAADGKQVMQCGGCGAAYVNTSMDAPKGRAAGVVPRRVERDPR